MACHIKNLLEFKKMYPGYLLDIGLVGFVDTLLQSQLCSEDMMGLFQFEAALATPQFGMRFNMGGHR